MQEAKEIPNQIDFFTLVSSVTWPFNDSKSKGDLNLIQTSLPLLSKSSSSKQGTSSHATIQRLGHRAEICKMVYFAAKGAI